MKITKQQLTNIVKRVIEESANMDQDSLDYDYEQDVNTISGEILVDLASRIQRGTLDGDLKSEIDSLIDDRLLGDPSVAEAVKVKVKERADAILSLLTQGFGDRSEY